MERLVKRPVKRAETWPVQRLAGSWITAIAMLTSLCACQPDAPPDQQPPTDLGGVEEPSLPDWHFTDMTEEAGIRFQHFNDGSERRLLPETMGAGAIFFDYDGDGRPDIYLVNGASLDDVGASGSSREGRSASRSGPAGQPGPGESSPTGKLYRNLGPQQAGNGSQDPAFVHFEDVTESMGLAVSFYGMGAAAADVDSDGDLDLFVSAVGPDRLFINEGKRFVDRSREAGFWKSDAAFSTSVAFDDYDRDGDPDLFVCRYVQWSAESDVECLPDGTHRAYCTPELYDAIENQLWRNDSDANGTKFTDVTESSGIGSVRGKALGVAALDHGGDGWCDWIVANDTERNFLFLNQRDGTFVEAGLTAGVALSESGAARGGMGVDVGDLDGNGMEDVLVANFSYEMSALFLAQDTGVYLDDAPGFGLGLPTLPTLAFGLRAVDLDLDGWKDVIVVNGHIEPQIDRLYSNQKYRQAPQVFRNEEGKRLVPIPQIGDLNAEIVGRGLAVSDVDGDGDLDLLLTENGGGAYLYRNDFGVSLTGSSSTGTSAKVTASASSASAGMTLTFQDAGGNVSPFGVRALLFSNGESTPSAEAVLRSGSSYLSAREPSLFLGARSERSVDSLQVHWLSGNVQTLRGSEWASKRIVEEAPSP